MLEIYKCYEKKVKVKKVIIGEGGLRASGREGDFYFEIVCLGGLFKKWFRGKVVSLVGRIYSFVF